MSAKYQDIKEDLIEKIENNEYKKGEILPTERELTSLFNVSRMTIRRALEELINEGYAFRKSGSGVFVLADKNARSSDKISVRHDSTLLMEYGEITSKPIELKKIKANRLCQTYLLLDKDEDVYLLRRLQSGKDKPLLYEEIYFPCRYFNAFSIEECSQSIGTLVAQYMTIKDKTNSYQEIEAIPASKKISQLLHIPVSSPVLKVVNIVGIKEKDLYFGVDYFDGHNFKFYSGK